MDNRILWLPDVFGYSGALPQIMKKSGVDYFMTTKLSWNQIDKVPNEMVLEVELALPGLQPGIILDPLFQLLEELPGDQRGGAVR